MHLTKVRKLISEFFAKIRYAFYDNFDKSVSFCARIVITFNYFLGKCHMFAMKKHNLLI